MGKLVVPIKSKKGYKNKFKIKLIKILLDSRATDNIVASGIVGRSGKRSDKYTIWIRAHSSFEATKAAN